MKRYEGREVTVKDEDLTPQTEGGFPLRHLLLPALVLAVLAGGCRKVDLPANWNPERIVVDGTDTEWSDLVTVTFEKKRLTAGLANDGERLYLALRINDTGWLQTLRAGSVIVWVDVGGGNRRELGFRYVPAAVTLMPGAGRTRQPQPSAQEERLAVIRSGDDLEINIPRDGSRGPAAAGRVARDEAVLELSLPLVEEPGRFGIGAAPGREIGLVVEFEVDRNRLGGLAGQRPGGLTGIPGGGIGGGRRPGVGVTGGRSGMAGGMMPGAASPKEAKIRIVTTLAGPPG